MTATAILIALLFIIIFAVVRKTVFDDMDEKLISELGEVKPGLSIGKDSIILVNMYEWEEREHRQFETNPIFLEILDLNGAIVKKSDNLFDSNLDYIPTIKENLFFNTTVGGKRIREFHAPLKDSNGNIAGFMLIGLPSDEAFLILNKLENVLIGGFFAALILLFFITRWIAGRSIVPINKVISTAEKITKENLGERIELPANKDEIHTLTATVNGLLDRLEDAVLREKQFTADASHELRTPLSVIKGTLEVLVRKPRDIEHYESKISYCIREVNRMTGIIDQLLLLARYESEKLVPHNLDIDLIECIRYTMLRIEPLAQAKGINIKFDEPKSCIVNSDPFMLDVILENLISNSIKYSNGNKQIDIIIDQSNGQTSCSIKDYGIGMSKEEIARIYDRFYRGEQARKTQQTGDGIGLAIVKRLADLQNLRISYSSEPNKGTTATINFPNSTPVSSPNGKADKLKREISNGKK